MPDLRAAFERDGFVRVPDVLPGPAVAAMRAATLAALTGLPLVELIGARRPAPGHEAALWAIGRGPAFAPVPAALAGAVDRVFGPGAWAPLDDQQGGLVMPALPVAGPRWSVPHEAWHVDEPTAPGQAAPWGLLGFALLDEVGPGGGATVVIAGSHRRLGRLADARGPQLLTTDDALAALEAEPWFAGLRQPGEPAARARRYLDEGTISAGIAVRVVELTGGPGDLILLDPRCLHTVSANRTDRARLVLRLVCYRRSSSIGT